MPRLLATGGLGKAVTGRAVTTAVKIEDVYKHAGSVEPLKWRCGPMVPMSTFKYEQDLYEGSNHEPPGECQCQSTPIRVSTSKQDATVLEDLQNS